MKPRRMYHAFEAIKDLPASLTMRRTLACMAIFGTAATGLLACSDEDSQPAEVSTTRVVTATTENHLPHESTSKSLVPTRPSSEAISVVPSRSKAVTSHPEVTRRHTPLELYYGTSCEAIVDTQITNTITMDYVNSDVDVYTGKRSMSTKDGLYQRVEQAVQQDYRDVHIALTDEQAEILRASISHLVDESLGEQQGMDSSEYAITVASFANDFDDQVAAEKTGDTVENAPVYVVPNMNYCVYDLVKTD